MGYLYPTTITRNNYDGDTRHKWLASMTKQKGLGPVPTGVCLSQEWIRHGFALHFKHINSHNSYAKDNENSDSHYPNYPIVNTLVCYSDKENLSLLCSC